MRRFAALYASLDATTGTNAKIAAMAAYFAGASPVDAAWALFFLTGRRFKRFITSRQLRAWYEAAAQMPDWLFGLSYEAVGDTAETVALLLDTWPVGGNDGTSAPEADIALSQWVEGRLLPLMAADEEARRQALIDWWQQLRARPDGLNEVFVLNKLLTGALRVGVSQLLVVRALAQVSGLPPAVLTHRLMGHWEPTADFYQNLIAPVDAETLAADPSQPYPFYLASPVEGDLEAIKTQLTDDTGDIRAWQFEWKWDGIRAQLIKRGGQVFLWSRGEELISERFPELIGAAESLPDGTVIDGEVLAYDAEASRPHPFAVLQTRIGRKVVSASVLKKAPVILMAYDLLENGGDDWRAKPLNERRAQLEKLLWQADSPLLKASPVLNPKTLDEAAAHREDARMHAVEGLMIKRLASPYRTGRKRGDWWKWKIDPHTVDAVLLYAQPGSGRRANLYTDYTFAVWREDASGERSLVPVAKAYSGLSDQEITRLDHWIRRNTIDKFGPVRSVLPHHVFELGFEGIAASSRHKSGVALRFPRMLRWRHDKPVDEADTLETLQALLQTH